MLGAADRDELELGLDFLFVCNPFVKASAFDAEHLIRRSLLGKSHTVLSITVQDGLMSKEAMLENYAAAGLTIGTSFGDSVPELGIPEKGYKCTSRLASSWVVNFSHASHTLMISCCILGQSGFPTSKGPSGVCLATVFVT